MKKLAIILAATIYVTSANIYAEVEEKIPSLSEHLRILRADIEGQESGEQENVQHSKVRDAILKADARYIKKQIQKILKSEKSRLAKYKQKIQNCETVEETNLLLKKIAAAEKKIIDNQELLKTVNSLVKKIK